MADDFRRALLHHIDANQTRMTDLARATGVSLDVLKKLRTRPGSSTTVENGMLIAAYYGETVNDFVSGRKTSQREKMENLLSLLTPEERQLLEAQMLGLVAARARQ